MNSKTTNTEIFSYATEYTYVPGITTNSTTGKVASIKNNNGVPINYEYDANVNISKITQGVFEILYTYNELNELIEEDNDILSKAIFYSYDIGGNLSNKREVLYAGGTTNIPYSYDLTWKDKLINYNGKPITYDAIGNPLTYDGYTYTWEEGRQLKSIIGNSKNISYKYNDAGIRTENDVDGVVTKYYLLGDKVILEDNGADKIYYTYDSHNDLVSMNLNGVEYYYIRNAQGDIIGLYDKNGMQVVSYIYDSWGKLISTTGTLASSVGVKNPYRYRGYRYDSETGLYYLQSRYYNPSWGRFLNSDATIGSVGELTGANVFAYCKNNPATLKDPSGFRPIYTAGVETSEMRRASLATMSKVNMNRYQKKQRVSPTVFSVVKNIFSAAADKNIGDVVDEILSKYMQLGVNRAVRRKTALPTGLVKAEGIVKGVRGFSKAGLIGIALTGVSVYDNYHSGYNSSEALGRSAIDVIGTAALIGLAFTPIGLFGMITSVVVVTVFSEGIKVRAYND